MAHLASLQLSTLLCLFLLSAGAGANAVWQNGLEQLIQRCTPYYETFLAAGRSEDLAPHLLMAIAARESACEADAVSAEAADTGEHAYGLMQILPSTYAGISIAGDIRDPHNSIWAAARYLNRTLRPAGYQHAEELLIAYRWGAKGAKRKRGLEHEQEYVRDIMYAWSIIAHTL